MGSPRYSRTKGRVAENIVVDYLVDRGYDLAERRRLTGVNDKGDIAGVRGHCIEVKSANTLAIPAWLRETETERVNAGANWGLLVVKPRGTTDPSKFWAIRYLEHEVDLMRELDDLRRIVHGASYTGVK